MYQGWSVSRAIRHLLSFNKSYRQALDEGYANISSLSRLLKPSIENMLEREVSLDSVITALKRARKRAGGPSLAIAKVLAKSRLEVRTGVAKLTVKKTKRSQIVARDLALRSRGFFQLLDGITSITLIVDRKGYKEIKHAFPPTLRLADKEGVAALIVISPPSIEKTPGVLSIMLEQLARYGINVEEIASCHTDTIILLEGEDGGRGFDIIHSLIQISKGIVAQSK
jgi:hypothetical protein